MNKKDVFDRVVEIARRILHRDDEVGMETPLNEIGADSIDLVEVECAIEKEFGVAIDGECCTIGDFVNKIYSPDMTRDAYESKMRALEEEKKSIRKELSEVERRIMLLSLERAQALEIKYKEFITDYERLYESYTNGGDYVERVVRMTFDTGSIHTYVGCLVGFRYSEGYMRPVVVNPDDVRETQAIEYPADDIVKIEFVE